jgi:tetratricopeptide (TPR) repeat protein
MGDTGLPDAGGAVRHVEEGPGEATGAPVLSRAIGYVRVTMRGQGYETQLVRDQSDRIRAWCEMNDLELERICVDSGADGTRMDDRPAMTEALERLRRGDVLVACSLKKLSANAADALAIARAVEEKRAGLVLVKEDVDTTANGGPMVLRLLGALAALPATGGGPQQLARPLAAVPSVSPVPGGPVAPTETGYDPYGVERRREQRRRVGDRRSRAARPESPAKRSVLDTPISELLWARPAPEPPRTFSAAGTEAAELVRKGQLDKAIALWQRFLERADGNDAGMAHQNVADLLLRRGRRDAAAEHFLAASDAFRDLGLFSKAIASLKRVLKLQSGREDVYVRVGKLSALSDKVGDATAAYLEVASRQLADGDTDGALAMFTRVRMLDPVNARHRLQLAAEMIEHGLRDEGLHEALHGIDLLRMVRDAHAAERHLTALLDLEPGRGDVQDRLEAVRRGDMAPDAPEGAASGIDGAVNLLTRADRAQDPDSAWRRSLDFAPAG